MVNVQEVGCIIVYWIVMAKNMEQWRGVKDIIMKYGA